jgi:hypothetical protein
MTESEWLEATDPQPMLERLRRSGKASQRKLRLFACACCRHVWEWIPVLDSQEAVEVAERFADRASGKREIRFSSLSSSGVRSPLSASLRI